MQSDIKNDYSLWITELPNMDYKTVIQYLIDKYGEVDGNYFTDRSCQTVNIWTFLSASSTNKFVRKYDARQSQNGVQNIFGI